MPRILEHDGFKVLVVDDRSTDGTGNVAEELAAHYPGRVEVLHRTGNRGLGLSYAEAFPLAATRDVDVIVQMDADLSHDPRHLPAMVAATTDYDVVIGSRYTAGASLIDFPGYRATLSRGANAYVRRITGLRANDCTSGYRCWRRSAVQQIQWERVGAEGFAVLGVSIDQPGWDIVRPFLEERPVNYRIALADTAERGAPFGPMTILPTTWLIDREGRIASEHIGLVDRELLEKEIRQLLAE